jgi:hypothetical protein
MTQAARRRRALLTALAFPAALAASSVPVAQTPSASGTLQGGVETATQAAGGECGSNDTAYNKLYGVQGVMLTQDQADAATGNPGVYNCSGCEGHPGMEECWLKPGGQPLQAAAQQDNNSSGAPTNGIPAFPSPGTGGEPPTPGTSGAAPNRTPPTRIAQTPPGLGPPRAQPPARPPAQPPRQWNHQQPSCTGGGWNTANCTFIDNRGGKWMGPQSVECPASTNYPNYPFRSRYQIDPNSFSITTQSQGLTTAHATLQLRQYYPGDDPPAKTITVDFVLQPAPSGIAPRARESYCPVDKYTAPPLLNY